MRALAIIHQADAGPGVFAEAAAGRGWTLDVWDVASSHPAPGLSDVGAVLVFGGSAHPDQVEQYPWLEAEKAWLAERLADRTPLLGVCLGAQLLAEAGGGATRSAVRPEIGWHRVEVSPAAVSDPVLGPLAPDFTAFGWHAYECAPPPGSVELARSDVCLQAYRIGEHAWGIQFHAEVSRDDALGWIDDYAADPDAVRAGVDADALRAQTEPHIAAWNETGRALCGRFLDVARATP